MINLTRDFIFNKVINSGIVIKLLMLSFIIFFLVLVGGIIANIYLDMSFEEGIWWTWTHMMDPGFIGDDNDSLLKMLTGSFIAFIGVLIIAGAFLAILQEITNIVVINLKKGRIPKNLSNHTIISGVGPELVNYISAIYKITENLSKNNLIIVVPDESYLDQTKENNKNATISVERIWAEESLIKLKADKASRIIILDNFGGDISLILKIVSVLNRIRLSISEISEISEINELNLYVEIKERELIPIIELSIKKIINFKSKININLINMENYSSRLLLLNHPIDMINNSYNEGKNTFIIIGWSVFSKSLFQQVMKIGYYNSKTKIIISSDKQSLDNIKNDIEINSPSFLKNDYAKNLLNIEYLDKNGINSLETSDADNISIAICGCDNDINFGKALELSNSNLKGLKQIFIELPDYSGYREVIDSISSNKSPLPIPIIPVNSHSEAFELMESLDKFAKLSHKKYILERESQGLRIKNSDNSYENPTDYDWEMLDDTYKNWNKSPMDHAEIKLRTLADFHRIKRHIKNRNGQIIISEDLSNKIKIITDNLNKKNHNDDMELLSKLEHNRWSGEKFSEGWVFDFTTDKKNKKSNFLIPYDKLTEDIKQYDREQVVIQLSNFL